MNESLFELADNQLTAKDFIRLKAATGFMDRPGTAVEIGLIAVKGRNLSMKNSAFPVGLLV